MESAPLVKDWTAWTVKRSSGRGRGDEAGSGAAAIAAVACNIKYNAICFNESHKKWLDQLIPDVSRVAPN